MILDLGYLYFPNTLKKFDTLYFMGKGKRRRGNNAVNAKFEVRPNRCKICKLENTKLSLYLTASSVIRLHL